MVSKRIDWYRSPIDREVLRELTKPNDRKAFFHATAFVLIYYATTALSLLFFLRGLWGWMIVAAYVHSMFVGFVGMGAAVHELSHGTAFKSKRLNNFFFRLFAFLSWNSYFHFKESHRRHHQFTSYDTHDLERPKNPVPFTWLTVVGWITVDPTYIKKLLWTNLQHALGNTNVDFFFWCPLIPKEDIRTRELVRWARILILGHVLLAVVFAATGLWILIFTVSFSPFVGRWLSRGCQEQQHTGLAHNVPDWRVNAYTADFGPVMSFLYWHMNYHAEHDMYAAVPFYNLKRLRKALEPDLPVPIHEYWRGLAHLITVKRRYRRDPEYRYIPEFPPSANPPKLR